jgi:hypothetical protein
MTRSRRHAARPPSHEFGVPLPACTAVIGGMPATSDWLACSTHEHLRRQISQVSALARGISLVCTTFTQCGPVFLSGESLGSGDEGSVTQSALCQAGVVARLPRSSFRRRATIWLNRRHTLNHAIQRAEKTGGLLTGGRLPMDENHRRRAVFVWEALHAAVLQPPYAIVFIEAAAK